MILVKILLLFLYILGVTSSIYNATNAIQKKHYFWFSVHCTTGVIILLGIISSFFGG